MRPTTALFLAVPVLAILAAAPGVAAAAETHGHANHAAPAVRHDDAGKRWATDAPLREGMGKIRKAMDKALPAIHADKLDAAGYAKLADRISHQIDGITANCKLPEEADARLHVVLVELIDGAAAMKQPQPTHEAALKVLAALDDYGRAFDHPGWKSVKR